MKIGELASKTGVSVRVVRHYETQGLIKAQRLANGYRDYSVHAVERLQWVRDLLACGFSTRQIREFLPCLENGNDDSGQCAAKHIAKLQELDGMIDVLTERRRKLSERLAKFGISAASESE